jgi:hypothetical protein
MSGNSTTWAQEVRHTGLNKYQVVRGPARRLVEERAAALGAQWDAEWERRCDVERRRQARRNDPPIPELSKRQADEQADAAVAALASLSALLLDGWNADSRIDRERAEGHSKFTEPRPVEPNAAPVPPPPSKCAPSYQARLGVLEFFSKRRRREAIEAADEAYESDHRAWAEQAAKINADNAAHKEEYANAMRAWETRRSQHLAAQWRQRLSSGDRARVAIAGDEAWVAELIELARVEPREWLKTLTGAAASKRIGRAPLAPLEPRQAAGRRFIASRDVASNVDAGANIAAMNWRDFEQLVRQVFESEFASEAGEVRVTQASRDGGVDAIVFNPDPIRGGKIIIQAKRYTNTVDVGAVRDLYGAVVNEGASKGILVTTSRFGPDARKFAQGKPLTLVDGDNLLFLLEKMGVKARIDLKEAKFLLANAR